MPNPRPSIVSLREAFAHVLFVRAPHRLVADDLQRAIAAHGRGVERTAMMPARSALKWLLPLSTMVSRYLLRPFGEWTAIVSNGGSGSLTIGYSMACRLRAEAYEFLWQRDIRRIAAIDTDRPGRNRRVVQAYRDRGWVYVAEGVPLPAEDPLWAQAKEKSKRLTPGHVVTVLDLIVPACHRDPWSLSGPPMLGVEDGPDVDFFASFPNRPYVDDIGLDGPPSKAEMVSENSYTLSQFVAPETFLSHAGPGSFAGGEKGAAEAIVDCLGRVPGVIELRFELQAWEELESPPYAEVLWVRGATKSAVLTALRSCPDIAPGEIESVPAAARPSDLPPGRWLRLWWD